MAFALPGVFDQVHAHGHIREEKAAGVFAVGADAADFRSQVKHDDLEAQAMADYHAWWQGMLAHRHQFRPIPPDRRLVSPDRFP